MSSVLNFYSRPCGRGDFSPSSYYSTLTLISTHAPAGGATGTDATKVVPRRIYSRPCGRGRRTIGTKAVQAYAISTHAPAGGDPLQAHAASWFRYFYSRPCGRGDDHIRQLVRAEVFLLTPCGRGDANHCFVSAPAHHISTHALRRGDTAVSESFAIMGIFYSRPCGRGDPNPLTQVNLVVISTHAPAGGATSERRKK